jgi:acyl-CoA thioester hydrolase
LARAPEIELADGPWFETRVRVRYAETDKMGVVYHANFVVWFEVGRADLCRECGFSYRDMEVEDDAHLMVVDLKVRYRRPARYDDDVLVRTRVAGFAKRTVRFAYEVMRPATGDLLADGETTHVVTTSDGRPRSFPARQAELVLARLKGVGATGRLDATKFEETS